MIENLVFKKYGYSIFALALVLLLCMPLLLTGNWHAGDIIYEFYYNRAYGFSEMAKGEIPLWNPHQFTGYPFLESMQSSLFYPLNFLFIVLPTNWALVFTVVIHLFLAWWFMFILLRNWLDDPLAAFVGALVFALSGPITAHIYAGHITYLNAYVWLPIIVHFYRLGFKHHKIIYYIFAGAFSGVLFLTGYPQIFLFMAYIIVVYAIYEIAKLLFYKKTNEAGTGVLHLVLSGVICILISAVQLFPSLLFTRFSGREGGVSEEFATSFSMPPENIFTLLMPHILGDGVHALPNTAVAYWGRWLSWEIMPYAGIFCFLCFVLAFTFKNNKLRVLGVLMLVALICALGQYGSLYSYVYHYLPGFNLFRVPGRFLVPFVFGGALLVGLFLKESKSNEFLKSALKPLLIISGLIWVLVFTLLLILSDEKEGVSSFWRTVVAFSAQYDKAHLEPLPIDQVAFLQGSYAQVKHSLLVCLGMMTLILGFLFVSKHQNNARFFRVGLCILMTIDLLLFSHRYFVGGKDPITKLPSEIVAKIQSNPQTRIASKLDTEYLSVGSLAGISHVGGYDPAQLKVYSEFVNVLSDRKSSDELVIAEPIKPGNLLPLLSVKYLLLPKDATKYPHAEKVGTFENIDLYQLQRTVPRAYFVKGSTVIEEKEKRLQALKESYLQNQRVILQSKPKIPFSIEDVEKDTITWVKDSPHEIQLKLETKHPRMLVLTDAYYPLWQVHINKQKSEIFPVNHLFRGVIVPAGSSDVIFSYNKKPFYMSFGLTVLGLLIVIVACLFYLYQKRSSRVLEVTK